MAYLKYANDVLFAGKKVKRFPVVLLENKLVHILSLKFILSKRKASSLNTLITYSKHLCDFISQLEVDKLEFEQINDEWLEAYANELTQRRDGETNTSNYVGQILRTIISYLLWCEENKYCRNLIGTDKSARIRVERTDKGFTHDLVKYRARQKAPKRSAPRESWIDIVRRREWSVNRVRSSFFPSMQTITPFIVGLLSTLDLSLNVDTAVFYCYLTSFKPALREGKVAVFFDKFRGSPLEKEVDASEPIIAACVRHVHRMKSILPYLESEEAIAFSKLEKCPLFLQYTPTCISILKTPDNSTVIDIVRKFIIDLSEDFPALTPLVDGKFSGENFRPTMALIMVLTGDSSTKIQKILNHAHASTTHLYTNRLYTQSLIKTKAKDFQRFLVNNAQNIGMDNKSSETKSESDEAVDEWINCKANRVWFQDVAIIAEWMAWETAIKNAEKDLSFDNSVRWERYWVPRLVKYSNLLSMVSSANKKSARVLAEKIVLPPLS